MRSGIWRNVGLAALFVLDVPLLVAAVHHGEGRASGDPTTVARAIGRPAPATSMAAATTPRASHRRTVLVSFSNAVDGWRAYAGCRRPAQLQATTDGGRTWTRLAAPAQHVLRIVRTGPTAGWLVGTNDTCAPTFYSTSDAGRTWAAAAGLAQAWVAIGSRLRLPSGGYATPCGSGAAPVGVAPASLTVAIASCRSGLLTTADGGLKWAAVAAYPHGGRAVAAALEPGTAGRGVALLTGAAGCDGLAVVVTDNAGARWRAVQCLAGMRPPAGVSLAADGSGVVLAGRRTAHTVNSGERWS